MANRIHVTESKVKEKELSGYEVIEELGDISTRGKATLKLRYVKWGNNDPKYDIRAWKVDDDGNETCFKGITLSGEELLSLRELLIGLDS